MQDTAVSAIYSIAYRVPTLIALVASIFVDGWQISMVNNNTKEEQITFFSNVGNTYSSIVFIIASGGVMCAKLAMTVLAVPSYYIGWTFIPILPSARASTACPASRKACICWKRRRLRPSCPRRSPRLLTSV